MRFENASRVRSLGSTAATPAKNASSARPRRARSLVAKLPTSVVAVGPCPRALLVDFPALRSHRFEPPGSYRTTIFRRRRMRPANGTPSGILTGEATSRMHLGCAEKRAPSAGQTVTEGVRLHRSRGRCRGTPSCGGGTSRRPTRRRGSQPQSPSSRARSRRPRCISAGRCDSPRNRRAPIRP